MVLAKKKKRKIEMSCDIKAIKSNKKKIKEIMAEKD